MKQRYYKKPTKAFKKIAKVLSVVVLFFGLGIISYVFFPLISWQVYFVPVFANQNLNTPIPKTTVLTGSNISSLLDLSQTINVDYTNAQNWFPRYRFEKGAKNQTYSLSIPKLKINKAIVSTNDNNLTEHLVHYGGTAVPPTKGTAVIFGHSTLPQLFNQKDYKTIFATLYELQSGDEIIINVDGTDYHYNIYEINVVDATDISVFDQNYNDSFLTLVTCTPPGTVWKRLLIRAKVKPI
jgi:sortase A